jgi:NAD(P)-dependent dehydrogenase (short-subunit alcohol dehydrogenase family)
MTAALFSPPDSLAPGLAGALAVALGSGVHELPWAGDLRSGVDVAGHDVLVTVAPRPRLQAMAVLEHAAWRDAIRDIAERPAAAARALLQAGGKRWIAVIPHLSSLPSPGSGPYGAGGVMLQTVLRVAVIENAATGFCANAIAVGPLAGSLTGEAERIARDDTPRGALTTLEELAALVQWLASDAPSSMNGETLKLDGGFSLTRKPRPAPSAEVAAWLLEEEWRSERP